MYIFNDGTTYAETDDILEIMDISGANDNFYDWVNDTYTAAQIICNDISMDDLICEYMEYFEKHSLIYNVMIVDDENKVL